MANGDNLVIGKPNAATATTSLTITSTAPWGVDIDATTETALTARTDSDKGGSALLGICNAASSPEGLAGAAVRGWVNFDPQGIGVHGASNGSGVEGWGSPGVRGHTNSSFGVLGTARGVNGVGVYGHSDSWTGVVGSTHNPATNFAGYFWGPVGISGPLTVFGKKSAAVPHPDGSYRLLYAMESPESWFEDFGMARLVRGRARVRLDRHFAAVVRLNEYHVFLTPEGDSRGLYVGRKTRQGFEVREQGGGHVKVQLSRGGTAQGRRRGAIREGHDARATTRTRTPQDRPTSDPVPPQVERFEASGEGVRPQAGPLALEECRIAVAATPTRLCEEGFRRLTFM